MTTKHIDHESQRRHERSLEEIEMRKGMTSEVQGKTDHSDLQKQVEELKSQLAQQAFALMEAENALKSAEYRIRGECYPDHPDVLIIEKALSTLASLRAGREG